MKIVRTFKVNITRNGMDKFGKQAYSRKIKTNKERNFNKSGLRRGKERKEKQGKFKTQNKMAQ